MNRNSLKNLNALLLVISVTTVSLSAMEVFNRAARRTAAATAAARFEAALSKKEIADLLAQCFDLSQKVSDAQIVNQYTFEYAKERFALLANQTDDRSAQAWAWLWLAILYLRGYQTGQSEIAGVDDKKTFDFYVAASKQQENLFAQAKALDGLGFCYYYGFGVPKNQKLGRVYYSRAFELIVYLKEYRKDDPNAFNEIIWKQINKTHENLLRCGKGFGGLKEKVF